MGSATHIAVGTEDTPSATARKALVAASTPGAMVAAIPSGCVADVADDACLAIIGQCQPEPGVGERVPHPCVVGGQRHRNLVCPVCCVPLYPTAAASVLHESRGVNTRNCDDVFHGRSFRKNTLGIFPLPLVWAAIAAEVSFGVGAWSTVDSLTCDGDRQYVAFRELAWQNVREGWSTSNDIASVAEMFWNRWKSQEPRSSMPIADGTVSLAKALTQKEASVPDYCLAAHVTAGFFVARHAHITYTFARERDWELETALPEELLVDISRLFLTTLMLFGHNRALDFGKVFGGWPVGAAELLEAYRAVTTTCLPRPRQKVHTVVGENATASADANLWGCVVGDLEESYQKAFATVQPLRYLGPPAKPIVGSHAPMRGLSLVEKNLYSPPPRCLASFSTVSSEDAGPPCRVSIWYLGTHESLFREVQTMWERMPDFVFSFHRLNVQGIYNPAKEFEFANSSAPPRATHESAALRESRMTSDIRFRLSAEVEIEVAPMRTILRLRLRKQDKSTTDAVLFLCTIPAISCSIFMGLGGPIVMYTANPATAQVPFEAQRGWLQQFSTMAADPRNQLLVSNTWSQAQFEYQVGVTFPMIRIHGLYTGVQSSRVDAKNQYRSKVLVYDRTNCLLAAALEVMRPRLTSVVKAKRGTSSSAYKKITQFVHMQDTDRTYYTFASFGAVIFIPGDTHQMAFYELYSMETPIFMISDPSRYMWPRLPFSMQPPEEPCGEYAKWVGTYQVHLLDGTPQMVTIDCLGNVTIEGNRSKLEPLDQRDVNGFTHCLIGALDGLQLRVNLQQGILQLSWPLPARPMGGCHGAFDANVEMRTIDGSAAAASGTFITDPPPPLQMWDHDIFASQAWYLDKKLPGPLRRRASPFNLGDHKAVHEWSKLMDYFLFPAVGLFSSASDLMVQVSQADRLRSMVREMRDYNAATLLASDKQWETVMRAAVADGLVK
eukprot:TRINITY_DN61339_c0_g1_i1.p1 TRINITY_DN61339_c0_g1~~TRINITY_DN61339_c0_g1_i1.p1  ORF type:complete len:950 (-),score=121.28 TRINITY_DN61339_c0_g1_i1:285-3134(-)